MFIEVNSENSNEYSEQLLQQEFIELSSSPSVIRGRQNAPPGARFRRISPVPAELAGGSALQAASRAAFRRPQGVRVPISNGEAD
jgi:hypothetical protein